MDVQAPRSARPCRPSPWCRSSFSGLADRWASLSSRPCLPCCRKNDEQQGPFAPRTLLRFDATTSPSVTLSSSADFPVLPVIRLSARYRMPLVLCHHCLLDDRFPARASRPHSSGPAKLWFQLMYMSPPVRGLERGLHRGHH